MAELKPCPFDNRMCMCQFCEDPCNNGLNCHDCNHNGKIMHTTYICTGFEGDTLAYLKNMKRAVTAMAELKPCPFCGGKNIDLSEAGLKTDVWFVQCWDCYATFPHFDSATEAAQAWNRRAGDTDA